MTLTATEAHVVATRSLLGPWPGPVRVALASILAAQWLRLVAAENGIVLLCERCGCPFATDTIRALCGACQRAQEVE